jgi:hypothetical protein
MEMVKPIPKGRPKKSAHVLVVELQKFPLGLKILKAWNEWRKGKSPNYVLVPQALESFMEKDKKQG